jgi:eukaryotic-like serine/threonine-protein kinase
MYGTEPRLVGGRYEIGPVLGYGGMAEVYRGRDVRLGREVAVKTLRADLARDPTFHTRFRREAQSAAALNHPAIVSVYDTGEDLVGGIQVPYIVMEYIEGRTLREVISQEGPFHERRALEITSDVCAALDYSHRMGIIHRDIKPANVMLTPDGSIKVMDFGIARATTATSSSMTQTAQVIGTAQYLSPEQARGETVDTRSDVYSTGVLLYELLTGNPPFRGDNPVAVAYQHVREMPQPPSVHQPDLSPDTDAIVFQAMAKSREERYQTAGDMRDDLERELAGRRVHAPPLGPGGPATHAMGATGSTRMLSDGYGGPPHYDDGYDDDRYGTAAYAQDGYDQRYDQRDRYPDDRYDERYPDDRYDRDAYPPAGGGRGNWWKYALAALGVVVVFGIAALVAQSAFGGGSGGGSTATVPTDLVNANANGAMSELQTAGFTNISQKQAASGTVGSGQVISVSPTGGTKAKKSDPVTLTVSSGTRKVAVPAVTNMPLSQAEAALKAAGLTFIAQSVAAPGQTANQVTQQQPVAGSQLAVGSPVTLTYVTDQGVMPNLVGQQLNAALSALTAAGFTNVQSQPQPSTQPDNQVLSQNVQPGTVALNTPITLTYSQQTTPTPTPSTTSTGILGGILGN